MPDTVSPGWTTYGKPPDTGAGVAVVVGEGNDGRKVGKGDGDS
jgi:hypothetical protein